MNFEQIFEQNYSQLLNEHISRAPSFNFASLPISKIIELDQYATALVSSLYEEQLPPEIQNLGKKKLDVGVEALINDISAIAVSEDTTPPRRNKNSTNASILQTLEMMNDLELTTFKTPQVSNLEDESRQMNSRIPPSPMILRLEEEDITMSPIPASPSPLPPQQEQAPPPQQVSSEPVNSYSINLSKQFSDVFLPGPIEGDETVIPSQTQLTSISMASPPPSTKQSKQAPIAELLSPAFLSKPMQAPAPAPPNNHNKVKKLNLSLSLSQAETSTTMSTVSSTTAVSNDQFTFAEKSPLHSRRSFKPLIARKKSSSKRSKKHAQSVTPVLPAEEIEDFDESNHSENAQKLNLTQTSSSSSNQKLSWIQRLRENK